MDTKTFQPGKEYLVKLRVTFSIIAFVILLFGLFLTALIMAEEGEGGCIAFPIILTLDLVWYGIAMGLSGPYYRSLKYEIQDDEVIVRAGIWEKSVKHVPYRTVTNLTVKRGILDRWLGIGTLNIQTAGMSGTTGAEESLVGLPNVDEIYETVGTEMRRFRGGMSPTMADTDVPESADVMQEILVEIKAIRESLEK